MTERDLTLIRILASTDAVFRPMRSADWTAPGPCNLWEARQRFPTAGVAWTQGGQGRMAVGRKLTDLATAGMVRLCGAGKGRGVRLTQHGDACARALCGLPNDAHKGLNQVALLTEEREGLCSELWLAGLNNYTDDCQESLWETTLFVLPALVCRWVLSRSDVHGRVYFQPTSAGLNAASRPTSIMPGGLPAYSDEANAAYYEATLAARGRLRTAKPSNPSEIGQCPLPASLNLQRPRTGKAIV